MHAFCLLLMLSGAKLILWLQAFGGRNMTHVSPCVLQFAGKMVGAENLEVQLTAADHSTYGPTSSQVITGTSQVLTSVSPSLQPSQQTIQAIQTDSSVISSQAIQVTQTLSNVIQPCISTVSPT